ncbi:MAG: hypothetical protein KatS3mg035_2131 [Bacteroidia bacterium]|nr:MAG: hypothetical protein KatS3mg035_2131 [Bacteroidia bacterium]
MSCFTKKIENVCKLSNYFHLFIFSAIIRSWLRIKWKKLTALFKRRGFVYPGSEIYGGLANTYDYGPVGAELLRNIRNLWWKEFVIKRDDIFGLEASIISHRKVWEASGHTVGFSDALVDCRNCKVRIRAESTH